MLFKLEGKTIKKIDVCYNDEKVVDEMSITFTDNTNMTLVVTQFDYHYSGMEVYIDGKIQSIVEPYLESE